MRLVGGHKNDYACDLNLILVYVSMHRIFHYFFKIIVSVVDYRVPAYELCYWGIPGLTHHNRSCGLCSLFNLILAVHICISHLDGGHF